MERRQWILSIALLTLGGIALYTAGPQWLARIAPKKPPAQTVAGGAAAEQAQPPAQKENVAMTSQGKIAGEDSPWGRNPFLTEAETLKPLVPAGEAAVPTVRAIIMGRPKPVATVDGKVVTVGDKIGDERVMEIREDSVVLGTGRERRSLKIAEPSAAIEVKEGNRR
ncbi:MAG: hypothetical protein A3F90_11400 [Deltaproteobacteria bacterium RIFCSPLOWO2_12_FULL_60_19]|nr:MAG: hypothetical protein A3F90_11400 [Deltaproteobacteria bacterium RIFCSPLOWO2_12_FULL_60_19]